MQAFPIDHPANTTRAIRHPEAPLHGPCYLLFRNSFTLDTRMESLTLYVSGSQRLALFLDGQPLVEGPARTDREKWECMTVQIPCLEAGHHTLSVQVVHWGPHAGKGQIGGPIFLLVACARLPVVCSDSGQWKTIQDHSRRANLSDRFEHGHHHYAIGPGEVFDARLAPWGWQRFDYNDQDWLTPSVIDEPNGNPWGNRSLGCHLVPASIPRMRETPRPWSRQLDETGAEVSGQTIAVGPNEQLVRVYDAGAIVNAYPHIQWSQGSGATISLIASEAPIPADGVKSDRDQIAGCDLPGQADVIEVGLGVDDARFWAPPWMRSFRYYKVMIETADQAIIVEQPTICETTFPFEPSLDINIVDPSDRDWNTLIKVNRQTVMTCSHETIMDCPAWEQAQFPGDARIVARHHYLVFNDDRLALKAINDFAASRVAGGLLRSHWPSTYEQVIATYSLQWIGMLDDWRLYRGKPGAILEHLPTARAILDWFLLRVRSDGLLDRIDEAPFVDWAFQAGCPTQDHDGGSTTLTGMLAETLQMMARLESWIGYAELAPRWLDASKNLLKGLNHCWDDDQQLLKDTATQSVFSVHAQVQAALAGYWPTDQAAIVLKRALGNAEVTQPQTLYYRAHLAQALRMHACPGGVFELLGAWFQMLKRGGLTTWPESDSNPRSDCHGWGCTPEIELVHTLAGLTPTSPGFSRGALQPYLGDLQRLALSLDLPLGPFSAVYTSENSGFKAQIHTPIPLTLADGRVLTSGFHDIMLS